jgi:pimeloyl-ACP methyl ester carboxylesterase
MSTACNDIIAVLDALDISCVGLLFECAGAPFALAFAAKYKNRTNGNLMGIAPFVQPADCPSTKAIFQFGALRCPLWLISHLVANSISSLTHIMTTSLPSGWVHSNFKKSLVHKEYDFLLETSSEIEFFDSMNWLYEEKGDTSADLSVLLSKGVDIGIEYKDILDKVVIIHPEHDKLTPIAAAKWLSEQLPFGCLITLPDASHEGALFMLHKPIVDSLKSLGTSS